MDPYGYVFFIFSSTIIPYIQIDLCTSNKQEVRLPENRRYCRSSYSLHANGVRFEGPVSSLPAKGTREVGSDLLRTSRNIHESREA